MKNMNFRCWILKKQSVLGSIYSLTKLFWWIQPNFCLKNKIHKKLHLWQKIYGFEEEGSGMTEMSFSWKFNFIWRNKAFLHLKRNEIKNSLIRNSLLSRNPKKSFSMKKFSFSIFKNKMLKNRDWEQSFVIFFKTKTFSKFFFFFLLILKKSFFEEHPWNT